MTKPYDFSKFRKSITKSITGLSVGFNDPTTWIDTGSKILNYLVSGSFHKGIPLGKVSILAGEPSAGKSLLSANIIKNAQKMGIFVILIDTENALDEAWLKPFGVDTSEEKLLKLNMAMVDDVAKTIHEFVEEYKTISEKDRPQVLFVIDSLGMLLVNAQVEQFRTGSIKGDFGHKPKALKALITNCINMFGSLGIGLLATNHTYESQNLFSPDAVVSGGCLVADTEVLMSDYSYKAIQNIKLGDTVYTDSGPQKVITLWQYEKPTITLTLEDTFVIECTPEHKFLQYNWIEAQDLKINDTIASNLKGPLKIVNKVINTDIKPVYDIEVDNEHYYYLRNGINSHNSGPIFAASILLALKKGKLKEDSDGNKTTEVHGIRAMCKVMKSRFSQPFQTAELKIPYDTGLDEYSGLFEFFEDKKLLKKDGIRYVYTDINGNNHKHTKKEWNKNKDGVLDLVMNEFDTKIKLQTPPPSELIDEDYIVDDENIIEEGENEE